MLKACFLFLFLLSWSAIAAPYKSGCLTRHVLEAMALNESRMEGYLTAGGFSATVPLEILILSEKAALLNGGPQEADALALPFNQNGIGILCDEFESGAQVPAFRGSTGMKSSLNDFSKYTAVDLSKKLEHALHARGFKGLYSAATEEIVASLKVPQYHCMTRHLLESVARTAMLADRHAQSAKAAGLAADPRVVSVDMIKKLFSAFGFARVLDRIAAPVQSDGIPVICDEMPAIQWRQ